MSYFDYKSVFCGVAEYCEGHYTTEDCKGITDELRTWAQDNDAVCYSVDDIPYDVFQDIVQNY